MLMKNINAKYYIHLNNIYFDFNLDQESDYTGFEIISSFYKLDPKGAITNELISTQVHLINKLDIRESVNLNKSAGWNFKLEIPNEFVKITIRLFKLLTGEENNSPKKKYITDFNFSFNNRIFEIDNSFIKEFLVTEIKNIFKVPKYVWCNVPPIGGTDNDILILKPKSDMVQYFKFSDFYEKDLYRANFLSTNLSWWSIKILNINDQVDFSKKVVKKNYKSLITFISKLLKDNSVELNRNFDIEFNKDSLIELSQKEHIPDNFIIFLKFSSENDSSISDPNKRKFFYLTFIGDLRIINNIIL